jgi:putative ABC transport system permease protein
MRLVLAQGSRLALGGVALGAVVALLATRLEASLLFGVDANDPVTYACVALLLILVALAACFVPARRAASIEPMQALRTE